MNSITVCFRCEDWDVINEVTSEQGLLAQRYGSTDLYTDCYHRARDVDYAARLFANDKGLVESSSNLQVCADND